MLTAGTEEGLGQRLLDGDEGAFEEFVDAYRKRLFQFSYLTCGQREDAEEVAQETLLRVFENMGQLREPEHLRAWVFRIAKNVCYGRRRKSVFAPERELSLDELMPSVRDSGQGRKLEIADWSALPDELAMRGELDGLVRAAIGELGEKYRSVLLLRDVEGLSTTETAAALELSEDTVKQRLHRARLFVRQHLDRAMLVKGGGHDAGRV
jgi:RNA polymerase sigma-70 factor, ECF subfamily